MPYSFHSHSGEFCAHAHGTLQEVVECAAKRGFEVYGLSEHMPRYHCDHLYPEERELGWTPDTLADNFESFLVEARRLQRVTAAPRLLVGFETELLAPTDARELDRLRVLSSRVDYVVGSVHHVHGTPIDFDRPTYDTIENRIGFEALVCAYLDAQHVIITALQPLIIGHFDLIRLWRPTRELSAECWGKVERNIRAVIAYGGLVEVNTRGWKKGESAYPLPDTLSLMVKLGCRFTLGDDAHGPNDVGMHYDRVRKYLSDAGVESLWYLDRVNDRVQVKESTDWPSHPFWRQFDNLK